MADSEQCGMSALETHPLVDWLVRSMSKLRGERPVYADMVAGLLDEHEGWHLSDVGVTCRLCAPWENSDDEHVPQQWPCETLRLLAWSLSEDVEGYDRAWIPNALRYGANAL